MSRLVVPASPCQNCKTHSKCVEVNPPPRLHSGWECINCGEIRWGGVLSEATSLLIGYTFSGGCILCWRCSREHSVTSSRCPTLPYLNGFMTTLWSDDKVAFDRHCDECGVIVDANC